MLYILFCAISLVTACKENEFKCLKNLQCIEESLRCNGLADCLDGTDEWYNCSRTTEAPSILGMFHVGSQTHGGRQNTVASLLIKMTFLNTFAAKRDCS